MTFDSMGKNVPYISRHFLYPYRSDAVVEAKGTFSVNREGAVSSKYLHIRPAASNKHQLAMVLVKSHKYQTS